MSNKYNNIETNIIRALNIIKISALVGIIVLFILQKTTDAAGQALWVKTALIIVAGVGFSAMISGSLIK